MKLIVLRHGERADEAAETNDTFDPPLTDRGKEMAAAVMSDLSPILREALTFVSPMSRTIETAEAGGHVQGRILCPGLASCAAAVAKRGGVWGEGMPKGFLDVHAELDRTRKDPAAEVTNPMEQFLAATVNAVCDAAEDSKAFTVCVTHREGIRELYRLARKSVDQGRLWTPYCCVAVFEVVQQNDVSTWKYMYCRPPEEASDIARELLSTSGGHGSPRTIQRECDNLVKKDPNFNTVKKKLEF